MSLVPAGTMGIQIRDGSTGRSFFFMPEAEADASAVRRMG